MSNIVHINAMIAGRPPQSQQQQAFFCSSGGTNLAVGDTDRIASLQDFKDRLMSETFPLSSLAINKISVSAATTAFPLVSAVNSYTHPVTVYAWAAGTLTVTVSTPMQITSGVANLYITGSTVADYNGEWSCTVTSATTFTIPMTTAPALSAGALGNVTYSTVTFAAATTFAAGNRAVLFLGNMPNRAYKGVRKATFISSTLALVSQQTNSANYSSLTTSYAGYLQETCFHLGIIGSVFKASTGGYTHPAFNLVSTFCALTTGTLVTFPLEKITLSAPVINSLQFFYYGKYTTFGAVTYNQQSYQDVYIDAALPNAFNRKFSMYIAALNAGYFDLGYSALGSAIQNGKLIDTSAMEIWAMCKTWFDQNDALNLYNYPYVIELGNVTPATALANFDTWRANNPSFGYAFVLPRSIYSSVLSNAANTYDNIYAKTYFFANYYDAVGSYYIGHKSIASIMETPWRRVDEYQSAALAYNFCNFTPDAIANRQIEFSYVYNMTPYVQLSEAVKKTYTDKNVSLIDTGYEGGITNMLVLGGMTSDADLLLRRDMSWWRAVDWVQIEMKKRLAAEVIVGSNSLTAPLYYNQAGIDRLRNVAQSVIRDGVAFGLLAYEATVNAISYKDYTSMYPNARAIGEYGGLSVTIQPQVGFDSITIDITYTD